VAGNGFGRVSAGLRTRIGGKTGKEDGFSLSSASGTLASTCCDSGVAVYQSAPGHCRLPSASALQAIKAIAHEDSPDERGPICFSGFGG